MQLGAYYDVNASTIIHLTVVVVSIPEFD